MIVTTWKAAQDDTKESREAQHFLLWSKEESGTAWWKLATLTTTAMTKDKGCWSKEDSSNHTTAPFCTVLGAEGVRPEHYGREAEWIHGLVNGPKLSVMVMSTSKDIRQDSLPKAVENYKRRGFSESGHRLWIQLSTSLG